MVVIYDENQNDCIPVLTNINTKLSMRNTALQIFWQICFADDKFTDQKLQGF